MLIGAAWEITTLTCLYDGKSAKMARCPHCRSLTCPECRETCFGCGARLPHFFEEGRA